MSENIDKSIYEKTIQEIIDSQNAVDEQYKKTGNAATTNCDINQIVPQIQNMSVTRNRAGNVIGYDYVYSTPQLPNTDIMDVDSNTDTGYYGSDGFGYATGGGGHSSGGGAGRERSPNYPITRKYVGTVDTDPESENKLKNGGFVSSLISSAYAGVSALSKLGKNVMATTGEALANFTEGMSQNFADFLVDAGNIQGDAIRALFGVDTQGNTTMYLDENTIGALAIIARDTGFFDDGNSTGTIYPEYNSSTYLYYPGLLPDTIPFGTSLSYTFNNKRHFRYDVSDGYIVCCKRDGAISHNIYIVGNSDTIATRTDLDSGVVESISLSGPYQCRGKPSYIYYVYNNNPSYMTDISLEVISIGESTMSTTGAGNDIAWHTMYGIISSGGNIPGVSTQPGATVPVDAITGADPHVVAQNLADNYSQIMGEPVLINVMDDSCNETTIKYYSVPISYSPTNLNTFAPITGGLQVSPSFNPDVVLDLPDIDLPNYIDQITKIINGGGAGRDVTIEPIVNITPSTPLGPDTPSIDIPGGSLPAVIPSTGTGESPGWQPGIIVPINMWRVYNPESTALNALARWLWTTQGIETQWSKVMQNPIDGILGFHAIYYAPIRGGSSTIIVGNLDSEVGSITVGEQYRKFSCGKVWITEYFGNVFDYHPYTTCKLYLPFIGIVSLDIADIMRGEIEIEYTIDFFTGACIAEISVIRDGVGGVLYQFNGNCAISYPITSTSYNAIINTVSALASGAFSSIASGSPIPLIGSVVHRAITPDKMQISNSGTFSGNAGAMGSKKPYFIISRPITEMAINYENFDGIGANKQTQLQSCSGFTRCKEVHLNIPGALYDELQEIETLLKQGVIV